MLRAASRDRRRSLVGLKPALVADQWLVLAEQTHPGLTGRSGFGAAAGARIEGERVAAAAAHGQINLLCLAGQILQGNHQNSPESLQAPARHRTVSDRAQQVLPGNRAGLKPFDLPSSAWRSPLSSSGQVRQGEAGLSRASLSASLGTSAADQGR